MSRAQCPFCLSMTTPDPWSGICQCGGCDAIFDPDDFAIFDPNNFENIEES